MNDDTGNGCNLGYGPSLRGGLGPPPVQDGPMAAVWCRLGGYGYLGTSRDVGLGTAWVLSCAEAFRGLWSTRSDLAWLKAGPVPVCTGPQWEGAALLENAAPSCLGAVTYGPWYRVWGLVGLKGPRGILGRQRPGPPYAWACRWR